MRVAGTLKPRTYIETGILRQEKIKYFLAYEGIQTEPQYFDGIRKYAEDLGINAAVEIISLNRSYHEEGDSNPFRGCLPHLLSTLTEFRNEVMTINSLATHTVDCAVKHSLIKWKSNQRYLKEIHAELITRLNENGYPKTLSLSEEEINTVGKKAYEYMGEILACNFWKIRLKDYIKHIHTEFQTCSKDDKACLIIDRDTKSFTAEQYDHTLNECEKNKISVYISNPCFEFWILLHFSSGKDLNGDKLQSDKQYLNHQLKTFFPEYEKRNIQFIKLLPNIPRAIENEKQYCETPAGLKNQLGTNVGLLLTELMKQNTSEQHMTKSRKSTTENRL